MTTAAAAKLQNLEGRTVSIALAGGFRIDECQLVSLPAAAAETFWVYTEGEDRFLPAAQVLDLWEAMPPGGRAA